MSFSFAIIGAGMAGLACADGLAARGFNVTLFDKGRGPGGRMSTKRIETDHGMLSFDHGAQYFTARAPAFQALVAQWHGKGLVAQWPLVGPDVWVGVPGMSAVIRHMAQPHDVRFGCLVTGLHREATGWSVLTAQGKSGPFDGVIIALPAEQAAPLLALQDFQMAQAALLAKSQPCWTALFAFDRRVGPETDFMRDKGILTWAARNSAKPGRGGMETWVVQATANWSAANLELAPDEITGPLLDALGRAAGAELPVPTFATAHRWRYALSAGAGIGSLWNPHLGLGVCGDWLLGPRVECAWLSGTELGEKVGFQQARAAIAMRV